MDKYEYRIKTEQMLKYAEEKSYRKAMEIADTIDWRKVKNSSMLSTVSEIYENMGELQKAKEILFIAYDKAPTSRKIVYRLGLLSLKSNELDEAMDCYEEFVKMAPKDPNQHILKYKILRAQNAPITQQIEALEDFKHAEYVEKWAYELAKLYHEAGMTAECLEECDDLILWFSEGTYVYQAMELKMKYKPLTPLQQEKYDSRFAGEKKEPVKKKPMFKKPKERPAPDPRIAQKIRENVHVTGSIDLPDLPEPMAEIVSPDLESLPDERPVPPRPRTKIENTSEIVTTISGSNLADVLKAGVAVASGVDVAAQQQKQDDPQVTGQMKIEEILANWEVTQRENAKIIEKNEEEKKRRKAARKQEEESLGDTKTILADDIRRLMEELENGTEPSETLEDEEKDGITEEYEDDDVENMGNVVESLQLDDDDDEYEDAEEYEEEEYEDAEEYEEDEYEDAEEYADEEYEDDEYEEEYDELEDEYLDEKDVYELDIDAILEAQKKSDSAEDPEFAINPDFDIELESETDSEPASKKRPRSKRPEQKQEVLEIEEPSEEEITSRMNKFDTGFIVQGRYDLSATSEIGLKAGLTEEQKKLFSYFVPIRGVSEQLVEVLDNDKRCKNRYGTSRTGNIVVVGKKGTGKTVLAVDIVKAIQKQRKLKQGKVAIITGDSLNKKELGGIIRKLNGGALIIEKAAKMNARTVNELNDLMDEQTGELLFVLEEQKKPLEKLFAANPNFKKKFTSRLELPVFINDELVTFGQTYAKENGYRIDEMGILALYSRIDMMQREDHAVTVAEVKEIMDEAIEHSQKANVKHLMKRVFGKNKDDSDRVILKEEDFKL